MNVADPRWSHEEEGEILERLRRAYEQQGYSFVSHPTQDMLPASLGSYTPDAVASRHGHNIIIEIKTRRNKATETKLSEIQHRISSKTNWKLNVVFCL